MARGMKGHLGATDADGLAIRDDLRAPGEALAETQPHDIEGLLRGEHGAMTGAGVIGMAVRDHRLRDRTRWVDMKVADLAAETVRRRQQDLLRLHGAEIVISCKGARVSLTGAQIALTTCPG